MTAEDRLILIAIIGRAQGINGRMRLNYFGDSPESLKDYACFYGADGAEYPVAGLSFSGGAPILALKGVADRNAAEKMAGAELFIKRSQLPAPGEDDTYYNEDLIGLEAFSEEGERIGEVSGLFNFGGGDLLEIMFPAEAAPELRPQENLPAKAWRRRRQKQKAVLIPFSKAAVPQVDLAAGRLMVNRLAAGLSDDADDIETAQMRAAAEAKAEE